MYSTPSAVSLRSYSDGGEPWGSWPPQAFVYGGLAPRKPGLWENGEPLARQLAGRAHEAADSCSSRYSPAVLKTCQLLIQKQEVFLIL